MARAAQSRVILFGALVLTSCGGSSAPPAAEPRLPVTASINGLGHELAKQLLSVNGGTVAPNLVLSPPSIYVAVSMLASGAAGDTAMQLRNVLGARSGAGDPGKAVVGDLLTGSAGSDEEGVLVLANAFLTKPGFRISSDFARVLRDNYRASHFLSSDKAAISQWISSSSREQLDSSTLSSAGQSAPLALLSVASIRSSFVFPFSRSGSAPGKFHDESGNLVDVVNMTRTGRMWFLETPSIQIVRLPLKAALSLVIALPRREPTTDIPYPGDILAAMTKPDGGGAQRYGRLLLPRFSVRSSVSLREALRQVGVRDAFDAAAADFSPAGQGLYLDDLKHEAVIRVDEDGVSAAAITTAEFLGSATLGKLDFEMIVDRMFWCLIVDDDRNLILFAARVTAPKS